MSDEQALPRGENDSAEVVAIPASTIILLRETTQLEVLMLRRSEQSSFVPDTWVFPGGALEPEDQTLAAALGQADLDMALRVCGIRETLEEVGVWLGGAIDSHDVLRSTTIGRIIDLSGHVDALRDAVQSLVLTSHWITPIGVPKRFDTRFYLSRAPEECEAKVDAGEAVDLTWISPNDALQRHRAKEMPMVFPTIKNLEAILPFTSIEALLKARRGAEIVPIQPLLVSDGGKKKIVLP